MTRSIRRKSLRWFPQGHSASGNLDDALEDKEGRHKDDSENSTEYPQERAFHADPTLRLDHGFETLAVADFVNSSRRKRRGTRDGAPWPEIAPHPKALAARAASR